MSSIRTTTHNEKKEFKVTELLIKEIANSSSNTRSNSNLNSALNADANYSSESCFKVFEGYGIEIELMIVDQANLGVRPLAEDVLRSLALNEERNRAETSPCADQAVFDEVSMGETDVSNELVCHVIELKTHGITSDFAKSVANFQSTTQKILNALKPLGGVLLPTGMHPMMNPYKETRLWPHGQKEIYCAYNRIFDCQGHGWSNLQSVHLNLPFQSEDEFVRLHAAVRLILPLLPALAASSPIVEGKVTGFLDNRLEYYRKNQTKVPSVTGHIVPPHAHSFADYRSTVLETMWQEIAPFDPDQVLREEWLNSHGVIARFDRSALEIRLIDTQECPAQDVSLCFFVGQAVKTLFENPNIVDLSRAFSASDLGNILKRTLISGLDTETTPDSAENYAQAIRDAFALPSLQPGQSRRNEAKKGENVSLPKIRDLCHQIYNFLRQSHAHEPWMPAIELILREGNLANRILKQMNFYQSSNPRSGHRSSDDVDYPEPTPEVLHSVYLELAQCLSENTALIPRSRR